MAIKLATRDDVPVLCALAQLMCEEAPNFASHPFDLGKTAHFIGNLHVAFILTDADEEPIGMIGGHMAHMQFSMDTVAYEDGLYILKEHRGAGQAVQLIRAFEEWAIENGATRIQVGTNTGVGADRTKALYERLGFAHTGYLLSKEVI